MKPQTVRATHHATILRNNTRFVHWLSPLDKGDLQDLLATADYACQLQNGEAVLIAYDGDSAYRHKRVDWLSTRLDRYIYIDRIIIGAAAQREGLGRVLYEDVADFARMQGFGALACEVNTVPDNQGSHAFHRSLGFMSLGEQADPEGTAVRYYVRKL